VHLMTTTTAQVVEVTVATTNRKGRKRIKD